MTTSYGHSLKNIFKIETDNKSSKCDFKKTISSATIAWVVLWSKSTVVATHQTK